MSCERDLRSHCQIENALPAKQSTMKIAMPHLNGSDFAMARTWRPNLSASQASNVNRAARAKKLIVSSRQRE